jgi:hypothetical protein
VSGEPGGPDDIRSLAVSGEDLVAAVEANRTSDRRVRFRVTPPFSSRMRARLHAGNPPPEAPGSLEPVYVDPERFLEPDAPAYPRPADTEDELRADPDEAYSLERHHEYHTAAVEAWREALRGAVRDRVPIETPGGRTEVTVHVLGWADTG